MSVRRSLYIQQRIKQQFLKWMFIFKHLGQVQPSVTLNSPGNIILEKDAQLGEYVKIYATPDSKVYIGEDTHIGTDSILYAFSTLKKTRKNIIIGKHCLIGAKSVILQDVVIGDNAIVGAGAVVTEGTIIKENEFWVGVPAKRKR